jgi:hypothetical protein
MIFGILVASDSYLVKVVKEQLFAYAKPIAVALTRGLSLVVLSTIVSSLIVAYLAAFNVAVGVLREQAAAVHSAEIMAYLNATYLHECDSFHSSHV